MPLELLSDSTLSFPDPEQALDEPNGLLAVGGDLSWQRLVAAYRSGVFPWFNEGDPLLWWSPTPRCIFDVAHYRAHRSLRKLWRKNEFLVTTDRCIAEVISGCRAPRMGQPGTWITDEMREAYIKLAARGFAHSIEVWQEQQLVGGLYGVHIGGLFCGESMFSRVTNASKFAFLALIQLATRIGIRMIDGQMENPHLMGLGGTLIARKQFVAQLPLLQQTTVTWPAPGVIEHDLAFFH